MPRSPGLPVPEIREVSYRTRNVERSLAFYTRLGFEPEVLNLPAFARASLGGLKLSLTGLAESQWRRVGKRARAIADREGIALEVEDLEARIESMKKIGFRFRHEIEDGPGGKRMRLEDPDGNPVDLVEKTREPREQQPQAEVPSGRSAAIMSAAHDQPIPARHAVPRR